MNPIKDPKLIRYKSPSRERVETAASWKLTNSPFRALTTNRPILPINISIPVKSRVEAGRWALRL